MKLRELAMAAGRCRIQGVLQLHSKSEATGDSASINKNKTKVEKIKFFRDIFTL